MTKQKQSYRCNKCQEVIHKDLINDAELEEYKKLGHFTCSTCINIEMLQNDEKHTSERINYYCLCNELDKDEIWSLIFEFSDNQLEQESYCNI